MAAELQSVDYHPYPPPLGRRIWLAPNVPWLKWDAGGTGNMSPHLMFLNDNPSQSCFWRFATENDVIEFYQTIGSPPVAQMNFFADSQQSIGSSRTLWFTITRSTYEQNAWQVLETQTVPCANHQGGSWMQFNFPYFEPEDTSPEGVFMKYEMSVYAASQPVFPVRVENCTPNDNNFTPPAVITYTNEIPYYVNPMLLLGAKII